jgi:hypothetical protein
MWYHASVVPVRRPTVLFLLTTRSDAMRPRTVLFAFLVSFTILGTAAAQQQKGDVELQLQGSYFTTFATDVSVNVGTIAGKFAPFLTDNLQIGIGPTLTITTTSVTTVSPLSGKPDTRSDTKVTFGSTVFVTYSFLTKDARTVPYVGASWYKVDFSKGSERGWVGVNGGLRYFLTRRTSLDLSASFLRTITEHESGSMVLFAFGLSFLV